MPGDVVPLDIKFFETSKVISANQAKSPFILLNNKLPHLRNHSSLNIRPSSRIFRFFEADMLRTKLPIFEIKLKSKLLLLWTAKQILSLPLIANLFKILFALPWYNFLSLPCTPSPNTCKAANNISVKNRVNDVRRIKLKSFLTTLINLKSKLIILSSYRKGNCLPGPGELCEQFYTAKPQQAYAKWQSLDKPCIWITKEKFLHHQQLNLWRENWYSLRGLWFSLSDN